MGLLDEAIREHLELKRRSGADPSEIAREEQAALTPVFPEEHAGPGRGDVRAGHEALEATPEIASTGAVPADGTPDADARPSDFSATAQETAELDMQAVMEEDPDAADGASPVGPIAGGPVRAAYAGGMPEEDALEWEAPSGRDRESAPEDVPGQERLSFD
jgi:hypothetical protein